MGLETILSAKGESTGGGRFTLGEYDCTVTNLLYKSKTFSAGECLIAELKVIQTTNPQHPIGCERGLVFQLNDWGRENAMRFLFAVVGAQTTEQKEAFREKVMPGIVKDINDGKSTKLNGLKVHVSVVPHRNKKGEDTTKTVYSSV